MEHLVPAILPTNQVPKAPARCSVRSQPTQLFLPRASKNRLPSHPKESNLGGPVLGSPGWLQPPCNSLDAFLKATEGLEESLPALAIYIYIYRSREVSREATVDDPLKACFASLLSVVHLAAAAAMLLVGTLHVLMQCLVERS